MTEDQALSLLEQIAGLPDGSRITSAVLVYDYLDVEARDCWGCEYLGSSPTTNRIGLLNLVSTRLALRQLGSDGEL